MPVSSPLATVTSKLPAAVLAVSVGAVAIPFASEVTVALVSPPGKVARAARSVATVKVTSTGAAGATGLPRSSVVRAVSGAANGCVTGVRCPSPPVTVSALSCRGSIVTVCDSPAVSAEVETAHL